MNAVGQSRLDTLSAKIDSHVLPAPQIVEIRVQQVSLNKVFFHLKRDEWILSGEFGNFISIARSSPQIHSRGSGGDDRNPRSVRTSCSCGELFLRLSGCEE